MCKWNTKKDIWVHRTWKIEYNFADNFITVYKAQDNMKKEIKPAEGRLGVLVVGVGGAVSTTLIAGTLAAAKGLAKPIGSITQMATIKMEDGKEKQVRDIVPIANLKDIVFGGWDIFPENAYDAAMYAEVLKEKDLKGIKEEMEAIVPMPAAFDHNWAKRLNGTNIKKVTGRMDMVEQLRQDIRDFKAKNNCSRIVVLWAASTEIYIPESEAHQSLASLEKAMKENNTEVISPSMCYAYAAIAEGAPFIMGAPNLCVDIPAMWEFSKKQNVPIAGKDFKSGQTLMKTVLAPMFKTRMLGVSGWFSTNILGNRDGEVLDEPENFKTKEVSKLSVIDNIFEPEKFPDLYGDVYHKVRINYYPPRKDNKEAWDNIDIFGWMGYPMEIKVNFLCRDSILAAPIALDLVLFSDLAARAGMCGIQTWLSFFCKSPMHDKEHQPVHDLFTQWRIVKQTIREMVGETAPSYLD
jgi:myo-inositol-1-phosphate synthase